MTVSDTQNFRLSSHTVGALYARLTPGDFMGCYCSGRVSVLLGRGTSPQSKHVTTWPYGGVRSYTSHNRNCTLTIIIAFVPEDEEVDESKCKDIR